MSEYVIHFWNERSALTPCGVDIRTTPSDYTDSWKSNDVTCGSCKLERPARPASEAPEYRAPQHVRDMDSKLGAGDPSLADLKARHAAKRLEAVRASEEFALATMGYWVKVWREAAILRRKLEDEAGVPSAAPRHAEPAETLSGARNGSGFAVSSGQESFARWAMSLPIERVGEQRGIVPAAPVNSVDIRTEKQYAEGMNNLSDSAKSALISAETSAQGAVPKNISQRDAVELEKAGLIGPKGTLTRAGGIARARLVQAAEDAAFG